MRNTNPLLIFLLTVSILFWNPLSFQLYYSGQPVEHSYLLQLVFYIVPIMLLLVIMAIKKGSIIFSRWTNMTFSLSILLIFTGFLFMVNTIIGMYSDSSAAKIFNDGLIFKPNAKAKYISTEFDFDVEVNQLGLRDVAFNTDKKDRFRILCFGDSWTFGWGVRPEESWPKRLMENLKKQGYQNIEVVNCGQPGIYTRAYLDYMKKILPRLNADLVLVGVLQLDDLAQLYEYKHRNHSKKDGLGEKASEFLNNFIQSSFGHYVSFFQQKRDNDLIKVRDIWLKKTDEIMKSLDGNEHLRFERLNDTVKSMFLSGNLNPSLLQRYIEFPDRSFIFNNPYHPATKEAIGFMKEDLKKMKTLCDLFKTPVIFINLPYNQFTGHKVIRMPIDELDIHLMEHNRIDSIYRSLALNSGMDYIELTNHFQQLTPKDSFFFKYDGHPNRRGYEEMAGYIAGQLIKKGYIK